MKDSTPRWRVEGKAKRAKLPENLTYKKNDHISLNQYNKMKSIDYYDKLEIQEHLIDLWIVLRKVAKTVFIFTTIALVIPGIRDGVLTISPYEPAVLIFLNLIIKFSLTSLERGGDVEVFVGSPLTPVTIYINLAIFIAILISLPVTVKELMVHIRPGLTDEEYKVLKQLSKYAILLFFFGAFISFFVIMPVTLKILAISGGIIGDQSLLQMYSLSSIMNLLLWGTLGGGVLYASPIILIVLVNLEIVDPDQLAERRREIILVIFIIAAFVTPDPTMISMLILSLPLIIIVEIMISWSYKIELNKLLHKSIGF